MGGIGFSKPEECASILDTKGLDFVFESYFETGKPFVGPIYSDTFSLPLNSDEKKRDVAMVIRNLENNLDVQIIASCDGNNVKGYVLTADVTSLTDMPTNIETKEYSCGDRVRIQQNKGALIILI